MMKSTWERNGSKSMLLIVYIAKLVISRIRARILIGVSLKEVVGRSMPILNKVLG